MINAEEFTNSSLPGLTGIMMDSFTLFPAAEKAQAKIDASNLDGLRLVHVPRGFVIAVVDEDDATFFYANASGL